MQWTRAIAALRQRWWVVVLAGFLGLCGGLGVAAALPVRYESTATVFISLDSGSSATEFNAGSTFALNLVASYAEVATMPVVLRPVVVELDLDVTPAELAGQVEVQVPANTSLLDIVVTDPSPDTAAAIANAIAARLPGAVSTLSPRTEAGGAALRVTTTAPAVAATGPSSTSDTVVVAGAITMALLFGIVLIVALEAVRRPMRSRAEVAEVTSAPVIGAIPRDRSARRHPLPVVTLPGHPRTEQLLVARAAFGLLCDGGPPRCVMVCSAMPGDGRTSVAVNLAIALARSSRRVLLIDADMHGAAATELLKIADSPGLTGILQRKATLASAVRGWVGPTLDETSLMVLPPGRPDGAASLLESPGFGALLDGACAKYEIVIIDTPALLPTADSTALATHVDDALLVINARRTGRAEILDALDRLTVADTEVIGVVLNEAPRNDLRRRLFGRRASPGRPVIPPPDPQPEKVQMLKPSPVPRTDPANGGPAGRTGNGAAADGSPYLQAKSGR